MLCLKMWFIYNSHPRLARIHQQIKCDADVHSCTSTTTKRVSDLRFYCQLSSTWFNALPCMQFLTNHLSIIAGCAPIWNYSKMIYLIALIFTFLSFCCTTGLHLRTATHNDYQPFPEEVVKSVPPWLIRLSKKIWYL